MKVGIVCIAKNENLYIKDFLDHHIKLGATMIVGDNNEIGDDSMLEILKPYMENGSVIYCDVRGHKHIQNQFYQYIYSSLRMYFDWLGFIDCDEYLILEQHNTIEEMLSDERFKDAGMVHINWQMIDDCGKLYYEPKPVMERFNEVPDPPYPDDKHVKTFVKTVYKNVYFPFSHCCIGEPMLNEYRCVNTHGEDVEQGNPFNIPPIKEDIYIKHFYSLTIEEFVNRRKERGFADATTLVYDYDLLYSSFSQMSKMTDEKNEILKKMCGIK